MGSYCNNLVRKVNWEYGSVFKYVYGENWLYFECFRIKEFVNGSF